MSFLAHTYIQDDEDIKAKNGIFLGRSFIDDFLIGPLNEAGQRLQEHKTEEDKKRQEKSSSQHLNHVRLFRWCARSPLLNFSFILVY